MKQFHNAVHVNKKQNIYLILAGVQTQKYLVFVYIYEDI